MLAKPSSPMRLAISLLAQKDPAASAATVVPSKSSARPCWVMRKPPLSMSRAAVDSLWVTRSRSAPSRTRMSSSMSWGRVNMSGGPASTFVDEFVQQHAGDHVQGLEHALALVGARGEGRHLHFAVVQE